VLIRLHRTVGGEVLDLTAVAGRARDAQALRYFRLAAYRTIFYIWRSDPSLQKLRITPLIIAIPPDLQPFKKRSGKKADAKSQSKKRRTGRKTR
jgi:hypothetical protein